LLPSADCTAVWLHKLCSAVSRTVQFCKTNIFLQSCAHCGGRGSSVGNLLYDNTFQTQCDSQINTSSN
jgi:hypothetical protein